MALVPVEALGNFSRDRIPPPTVFIMVLNSEAQKHDQETEMSDGVRILRRHNTLILMQWWEKSQCVKLQKDTEVK